MHRESVTQLSQRQGIELKKDRHACRGRRIQSIHRTYARDAPQQKQKQQTLEGSQPVT